MFIEAIPHTLAIFGSTHVAEKPAEVKRAGQRLGALIAEHDIHIAMESPLGFPLWVAEGAHKAHGTTLLFSRAKGLHDHLYLHRLPLADIDVPIFTGQSKQTNQDILLASSQASVFGQCTEEDLDTFIRALNTGKPVGLLQGTWRTPASFTEYLRDHPDHNTQVTQTSDIPLLIGSLVESMSHE